MSEASLRETISRLRAGWVPTSMYSDASLFDLERTRLFGRSWQFMAHESEIPSPGDYVVRRVLEDSFVVIRGSDSKVRVFLNMCRHRGMQVVRSERGNARRLICSYHMWSYSTEGELSGIPFLDDAYGGPDVLNRSEHSLTPAPRIDTYNGLIFISLDPTAPNLRECLGQYSVYLDFYTKPSAGGLEFRGPQRWRFKANWKVSSENFAGDAYHTPHTHASVAEIGVMSGARASSRKAGATFYIDGGCGATFKLPDGSFEERLAGIGYPPELIAARREHWPKAVLDLVGQGGFIPSASTLFPNLSMLHLWAAVDRDSKIAPFTTFRLWLPISTEETEVLSWFATDKDASDEFKEAAYKAYVMCFGTSGMFEQDDMEAWSLVTQMAKGPMSRRSLSERPDGRILA